MGRRIGQSRRARILGVPIHRGFNIDSVNRDGKVYLEIEGELDVATAQLMDDELARAEATDARAIVVDLSRVEFIDSSGVSALLRAAGRSSSDGYRLQITGDSAQARKLFVLAGVADRLPLTPLDS